MKKLIPLTLACALLTSCGDGLKESSKSSPEAIGELITLHSMLIKPELCTRKYEITDYDIYGHGCYVTATTVDGETIITSTWTIHLY